MGLTSSSTLMVPDNDLSTLNAFGLNHFSPTLCLLPTSWHFASFMKTLPADTPPPSNLHSNSCRYLEQLPIQHHVPSVRWTCLMSLFLPALKELSYSSVHFPKPLALSILLSSWVRRK